MLLGEVDVLEETLMHNSALRIPKSVLERLEWRLVG